MQAITAEKLVKKLKYFFNKEKNLNYLYLSAFFFTFSISLAFIIRPTIKSIFEARLKREKLKRTVSALENQINKAVDLQSQLEKYRDEFYLLVDAIPYRVDIYRVMKDMNNVIKESGLNVENASISNINLVGDKSGKLGSVLLKYDMSGSFSQLLVFLENLKKQRRLKKVKELVVLKERSGAEDLSGENLNIKLQIEVYFLRQ